jgi:hypothetical protein
MTFYFLHLEFCQMRGTVEFCHGNMELSGLIQSRHEVILQHLKSKGADQRLWWPTS